MPRLITLQEEDLVHFARRVLHILETQESWGADTIMQIAECAELHDLGFNDTDNALFKASVKTLD